jgi:hypothetical protein
MKFESMSTYGVLRYSFDQKMRVPANLTAIDDAVLDVTIQPQAGSDLNNFNFTWNVSDFKPAWIELKLYFQTAYYVTSQDFMHMKVLAKEFFIAD